MVKYILEIRFRKNLAKLTGSAVRINSNKPKGKKTMKEKKKLEDATPGFGPAFQLPPAKKRATFNHGAMRPLRRLFPKINTVAREGTWDFKLRVYCLYL